MQSEQLFAAAIGVSTSWYVRETRFDVEARTLTIRVDFRVGSRFSHPDVAGAHPVHDTQTKRYRHLNFFQHECLLEVRVPRVKLPDGAVRLIEPPWAGKLGGFTLLFEALVLSLCREMPFAALAGWSVRAGTASQRSPSVTSSWRWPRRISPRCANWRSTRLPKPADTTT
jgi:transposase